MHGPVYDLSDHEQRSEQNQPCLEQSDFRLCALAAGYGIEAESIRRRIPRLSSESESNAVDRAMIPDANSTTNMTALIAKTTRKVEAWRVRSASIAHALSLQQSDILFSAYARGAK
jgi:hypothetical protein